MPKARTQVGEPVVADIFDYLRKTFRKKITPKTTKKEINLLIQQRIREIDQTLKKKRLPKTRKKELLTEKKRISTWPEGLFKKTDAWSRIKRQYVRRLFKQRRGRKVYVRSYQRWSKSEIEFLKTRAKQGMPPSQIQESFIKRFGYYRSRQSITLKIHRLKQKGEI